MCHAAQSTLYKGRRGATEIGVAASAGDGEDLTMGRAPTSGDDVEAGARGAQEEARAPVPLSSGDAVDDGVRHRIVLVLVLTCVQRLKAGSCTYLMKRKKTRLATIGAT